VLKASENPPILFPEAQELAELAGTWWVAHTKPRQQKALAWDILRLAGGGYFLPMYEARRKSRGRTWKTILPLFPGYVFLCCDDDQRGAALKTNRIANLIPVPDQAQLVRELDAVKRLLESKAGIDPYPQLKRGKTCRIRSGPLAGLEGQIERRKGHLRFIVSVSILGQGAMVEIDADVLEPTD